jgi:hypothetical protein
MTTDDRARALARLLFVQDDRPGRSVTLAEAEQDIRAALDATLERAAVVLDPFDRESARRVRALKTS